MGVRRATRTPAATAAVAATAAAAPATRVRARNSRTRRDAPTGSGVRSRGSRGDGTGEGPMTGRSARPGGSRDMPVAILTGVGLGAIVLIAYDVSTVLMAVLAAVVVVIAAGEAYTVKVSAVEDQHTVTVINTRARLGRRDQATEHRCDSLRIDRKLNSGKKFI